MERNTLETQMGIICSGGSVCVKNLTNLAAIMSSRLDSGFCAKNLETGETFKGVTYGGVSRFYSSKDEKWEETTSVKSLINKGIEFAGIDPADTEEGEKEYPVNIGVSQLSKKELLLQKKEALNSIKERQTTENIEQLSEPKKNQIKKENPDFIYNKMKSVTSR